MKKEEMLRAVGEIDEKYVVEAEEAVGIAEGEAYEDAAGTRDYERVEVKSGAGESPRQKRKRRGLWAASLAAVLVIGLCIGSFFDGAGFMRMGSSSNLATEDAAVFDEGGAADFSGEQKNAADTNNYTIAESEGLRTGDFDVATEGAETPAATVDDAAYNAASDVKLIYRADVSLQTTEFDESLEKLRALVESEGGYFESSELSNGSYFSESSYKCGYYTIRVPQPKYREFIDTLSDAGYVVYLNESVEDIGLEYFETEGRLETLKAKEERLRQLMSEAKDMSDIISIENALSDTEYQIEMYSSTLNRYDSLVGYSTICVTLEKVSRYDGGIDEDESFFARLAQSLEDGAANFLYALDCFANWISYNLITLAIIAIIIIVACKFHWVRSIRNWWGERKGERRIERRIEKK